MLLCSISIPAFADTPDGSTIDLTRTGSINLWKYDLSSAEMDGVWDSSYVSTGVRDENGVEAFLLREADVLFALREQTKPVLIPRFPAIRPARQA